MAEDGLRSVAQLQHELTLCRNNIRSLEGDLFLADTNRERRITETKLEGARYYEWKLQRRLARAEREQRNAI